MFSEYNTIEFKEKRNWQNQNRIDNMLNLLPEYCKDFDTWCKQSYVIKTRMEYLQDIYTFFCFLVKRKNLSSVKEIQLKDLEKLNGFDFDYYTEWLSEYKFNENDENEEIKKNTATTKKRKISSLRTFFHFLYIRELISCNPSEKAIMPQLHKKNNNDIIVLSDKERDLFLRHIDDCLDLATKEVGYKNSSEEINKRTKLKPALILRDKAIIFLLLGTGLRISELCAINCEDISFTIGCINVIRKEDSDENKRTDKVYLNPEVKQILQEYIYHGRDLISPNTDNYDALFISNMHSRMTPRAIEMMVKHYAEAVLGKKCGITPHKLRASFGTRYYAYTNDIFATSHALNHSSVDVTASTYVKGAEEAKKRAAEIPIN